MNATGDRSHWLPDAADVPGPLRLKLGDDFARFASEGLPRNLEQYLLDAYQLDVGASYAGFPLKNPWGKASGQLSMRLSQVEEACEAGLGFVVLKTVIAQDAEGRQAMAAWAVKEARMVAERIVGRESGREGWTISWKGRGWWQSFDDYLDLVRQGARLGVQSGMLVVPSVKYHLPAPGETGWKTDEYRTTTRAILDAYHAGGGPTPMPVEKDFSPTLAGSDRSRTRETIIAWLEQTPALIRDGAAPDRVKVGLKLFNSLDSDDFQREMLATVHRANGPDFLVYANRRFDPDRVFEGHKGIAYGGPDLSDRNLRLLSALRSGQAAGTIPRPSLEISATGDITSGRIAVEYLLRGCTSFQLHTFFQLPHSAYAMSRGTTVERALHQLYFDPDDGLIVWIAHVARRLRLPRAPLRLLDVASWGASAEFALKDLNAQRAELG